MPRHVWRGGGAGGFDDRSGIPQPLDRYRRRFEPRDAAPHGQGRAGRARSPSAATAGWGAQVAGRVRRLFQRYALRHLELTAPGARAARWRGAANRAGRAHRADRRPPAHRGPCVGRLVILHLGGRERRAVPRPARVGRLPSVSCCPSPPASPNWSCAPATGRAGPRLPGFGALRRQPPPWRSGPLCHPGAQALPAALRWLRHHDMAAREQIKRKMGLNALADDLELDRAAGRTAGRTTTRAARPGPDRDAVYQASTT